MLVFCVIKVAILLDKYREDSSKLIYSEKEGTGYPINEIMQAVAFVVAEKNELAGNRVRGGFIQVIESHIEIEHNLTVEIQKPDLMTPLIIRKNGRACLVGPQNPEVYAKLISFAPENKYKMIVRKITEEDLTL